MSYKLRCINIRPKTAQNGFNKEIISRLKFFDSICQDPWIISASLSMYLQNVDPVEIRDVDIIVQNNNALSMVYRNLLRMNMVLRPFIVTDDCTDGHSLADDEIDSYSGLPAAKQLCLIYKKRKFLGYHEETRELYFDVVSIEGRNWASKLTSPLVSKDVIFEKMKLQVRPLHLLAVDYKNAVDSWRKGGVDALNISEEMAIKYEQKYNLIDAVIQK